MDTNIDGKIEDYRNIFGSKLTLLMRARGLLNKDLAKQLKKSENIISLWKGRKGNPGFISVATICEQHNITMDFFVDPDLSLADADLEQREKHRNEKTELLKDALFTDPNNMTKTQQELADIITKKDEEFLVKMLEMTKLLIR